MDTIINMLRSVGPMRLAALGTVAGVLIALFVFLLTRLTTPEMGLLYGDLSPEDVTKVMGKLQSANVPVELRRDGQDVYVPKDRVMQLRLQVAQEGLVSGGSIGYEIFDKTEALGSTSFVQQLNNQRALEGELARTIRSIDKVQAVRVHLVLPRRELFSRESREPSASIVLKMRSRAGLDRTQVQAIQQLVAAAVPNLKPSRISIVDDTGNLLARGSEEGGSASAQMVASLEEKRLDIEARMKRQVESLVEKSLGAGNVRVEVSAELDFDRITTAQELFDPDQQVVRSTQTVSESSTSSEGERTVTVANNVPQTQAESQGAGGTRANQARTEETTNFEISKTTRTAVREAGSLRRMSVAVLVNHALRVEGGNRTYEPRNQEELDQLTQLVRSAVGFDQRRGDEVRVINMRFVEFEDQSEALPEDTFFGILRKDLFKIAEMMVLAVVALLIVLLVLRPLVSRALAMGQASAAAVAAIPDVKPPPSIAATEAAALEAPEEEAEIMIDLEKVEGQVKASSIKKLGQIVDKHPEEALAIIRNWMYQES
ncbi:MAG: flagellar M-ring protein FliF [Alphaproteobacteria bacterium]|nr:flagellar M-ring protein FliF [Alphaproteobacteria bacterium]